MSLKTNFRFDVISRNEDFLIVQTEWAVMVGLNEAIFLHKLHGWLAHNHKAGKNIHDGKVWCFNSISSWEEELPFWSLSTLKRVIGRLRNSGLVETDNFNKSKSNHTLWYTIDYERLARIKDDFQVQLNSSGQNDLKTRSI